MNAAGGVRFMGAPALLVPGFARLKEWAYAGVMFDLTGAAVSHLAVGDPLWHLFLISGLLAVAFVSYGLRAPVVTPAVR